MFLGSRRMLNRAAEPNPSVKVTRVGEVAVQECNDYSVSMPRKYLVNWPSVITAIFADSLVIWLPVLGMLYFGPDSAPAVAIGWILVAAMINFISYSAGVTVGTRTAGFRIQKRQGQAPGKGYAVLLTLASLVSLPVFAALLLINYIGNNSSPEHLSGYPLIGIRTSRRPLLQAADNYWRRWSA